MATMNAAAPTSENARKAVERFRLRVRLEVNVSSPMADDATQGGAVDGGVVSEAAENAATADGEKGQGAHDRDIIATLSMPMVGVRRVRY